MSFHPEQYEVKLGTRTKVAWSYFTEPNAFSKMAAAANLT